MAEIELQNLSKSFEDKSVIDSLNLTVNDGELVALLGPSGCGKTTTLNIIAGLLEADNGDLFFDNQSVLDMPTKERGAVLVFQNYLLFPHMSVGQNIAFGLKMRGIDKKTRKQRVSELLELVGLTAYADYSPNDLSGGQKQRVALARALAINPQVLLLDEPFSNLDANLREDMQNFIRNLHLEEEMTTIFVTHDRDEAMLMADQIAVMNQGKIEQYGKAKELYTKPKTRFVSDFFGKANYLKVELEGNNFIFNGVSTLISEKDKLALKLRSGKSIVAMIRPEFIELESMEIEGNKETLEFSGSVVEEHFVGDKIYYQVDIGSDILEVTELPKKSFEVGEEVKVIIALENIWFMEGEG
ncbi:ABC transporter ATP-binding protein [Orenia marismortui]|uniref:ABC transporter ATP-binding protein n=1 Tax=Orenia marismortui TaxID=46469 RepID=UPI00036BBAE5|nr:ABC transporter ATP-binding protein [Orenia marismortui]